MPPDDFVLTREFSDYKHSQEQLRTADDKAYQSQITGIASLMATHFEDDRKSFEDLRKDIVHQTDGITKWFMGISGGIIALLGGIIAVLIKTH